jgi:predicted RND superfamily exporter protein
MARFVFKYLSLVTVKHPGKTLAAAAILFIAAVLSSHRLKLDMTWLGMVPKKEPVVKEFRRILNNFEGAVSMITLAVEGDSAAQIKETAREIECALQPLLNDTDLRTITWKAPMDFIASHGLMLTEKKDLEDIEHMSRDFNLVPCLSSLNDNLEKTIVGGDNELTQKELAMVRSLDGLDAWIRNLGNALETPRLDSAAAHRAIETLWLGDDSYVSPDGKMLLMYLQPWAPMDSIDLAVEIAKKVEKALAPVKKAHPQQRIRATGIHVIAKDEMDTASADSVYSTLAAFVLVLLLVAFALRMKSAPLLAGIVLISGIVWCMGLAGIAIGRLNLMTVFCMLYLIGLGIDFSIHFMHGYNESLAEGALPADAVRHTFSVTSPGILTGGLTTTIAFLSLMLTDYDIFKELGFISGMGVLMCMVAAFTILPAFLILKDNRKLKKGADIRPPQQVARSGLLSRWSGGVIRNGILVAAIMICATAVMLWLAKTKLWFDANFLNCEAKGLESIELIDDMVEAFGQTSDNAFFTVPSLDSAYTITRYLEKRTPVAAVESPAYVCPPVRIQNERRPVVERIRAATETPARPVPVESQAFKAEIERLEANIIETSQMAYQSLLDRVVGRADRMTGLDSTGQRTSPGRFSPVLSLLDSLGPETVAQRLGAYQNLFRAQSRSLVHAMANPETITWSMVPQSIAIMYLSKDSTEYLISVYPKTNVWEEILDSPFLKLLETNVPQATGTVPFMKLMYTRGRQEGGKAMRYAIIAIIVLLLIDFRSIRFTALAMVPLFLALAWLTGAMGLLNVPLNLMNILALPLILGIGIDDGVHVCHRYRHDGHADIPRAIGSVGRAIFLTTATTMIAFGSLMFSRMRGNVAIGQVLFFGVGLCYIMTITVLPMLLKWFGKKASLKGNRAGEK